MLTDNSIQNDDRESTSLPADMTEASYRLNYIEIVPLTRNAEVADGPFTTNCDNGGWSAEVKQEMSTDSVSHDDTESGKCSLYVGKLFYIITTTKKYRTSHIVKCSVISMQKS